MTLLPQLPRATCSERTDHPECDDAGPAIARPTERGGAGGLLGWCETELTKCEPLERFEASEERLTARAPANTEVQP